MSNFAPRGAPPVTAATFQNDAGFQNACKKARENQDICLQRQGNMRSAGTERLGFKGQAGAFGECAALYGAFANMCGMTDKVAARQSPPPPQPKPKPQAKPPAASTEGGARPPPASLTGMSAACKAQLNQALEAADRGDRERATALYGTMRSSGCEDTLRGLSTEVDTALPERRMGSLSRNNFRQECVSGNCGVAPSTPEQSARAAANAFNVDEVMDFLFALGGLAVTAAGYYTPVSGGMMMNSNRFTTINQRARSTYGQGGPTHVAPRGPASTIR
jgi:hypothetical protein